jgi:hypothetical protein
VNLLKQQNRISRIAVFVLLYLVALVLSTFLHECAHGISNYLAGNPISTGFNRLGNAYMYPHDTGFREGFVTEDLYDYGPLTTLVLAIAFTIWFCVMKHRDNLLCKSVLAMALANAAIRFVPMVYLIVRLQISGNAVEDEMSAGIAVAEVTGQDWLLYVPVIISLVISIACFFFIGRKCRKVKLEGIEIPATAWFVVSYVLAFIVESVLDNYLRINWIP